MTVIGPQPLTALGVDAAAMSLLRRDTERALEEAVQGGLDVVETADRWGKDEYALRAACIERWIADRLREWGRGKRALPAPALFEALEHAREARLWAETPINKPLAMERILWRLATLRARGQ